MNRKIRFSILLILCVALTGGMLLFGMNTLKAEAIEREITASGTSGEVNWTLYDDGELYIDGNGSMPTYSAMSNVPWVSYRANILSVEVSNGVTSIGRYAFAYCSNLKSVNLPESLNKIEFNAFGNCISLDNITIPSSVTKIENSVFSGCNSLVTVIIPDSITVIGDGLFSSCSALKSVYLSENATIIERQAFLNCSELETVVLPKKLKTIEENAFYRCEKLKSINLSDTTTTIGKSAFFGCSSLSDVTLGNSVISIGTTAFMGCTSLNEIVIPSSVEKIENQAFYNCTSLKKLTINDGVEYIGGSAFSHCSSLEKVIIPESVTQIRNSAFSECTELSDISVLSTPEYVGSTVFRNTAFYKDYANWDNGFLYLNDMLIKADNNSVNPQCVIYSKTRLIAEGAFESCTNIKSISMSDKVEYINGSAFSYCTKLESIKLTKNLKSIEANLFKQCDSLRKVEIPDNVTEICSDAFFGCDKLENVVMHEGILEIKDSAFAGLPCMAEIYIPGTVTSINSKAFNESGITDIYYGNTKANWKRTVSGAIFDGVTVHYTLRSDDESVIIHHTDNNFDWEAGNVHLVVEDLGNASSSYEQNGFYNRLMVDPIQVLDIKLVDGDGNDIQPLSDEKITVKIRASAEFMNLMKSGLSGVSEYDIESKDINFINDCFVFAVDGETVSVPADESFLKKFKIIHWYSDAVQPTDHESFTHDEISVKNGYIVLETNHFSEYAVCTEYVPKKDYTIKWLVDGVETEQTVTEEAAITKPANPEKEGYTFIGWTPEVPDTMPAENLEFTAVWQVNEYTITFDTAGGTAIAPITLEYGAAITPPENPYLKGYMFKNWSPSIPDTMPAKDLTVTAVYEKAYITGIKIISLPNKTQYTYKSGGLDLSGIAVKEMYSDGTSKIITDTSAFTSYGFNTDSVGTKTVTVSYGGYTDEFEITVSYAWWQWIIRILLLGFIWY